MVCLPKISFLEFQTKINLFHFKLLQVFYDFRPGFETLRPPLTATSFILRTSPKVCLDIGHRAHLRLGEGGANVSLCGETQLGWYRDEPGSRWGCFYGLKIEESQGKKGGRPGRSAP